MILFLLFLAATLGLVYLSRASLTSLRFHGFYRFLAWESILALVLLNLDTWFRDLFTPSQLVSWLLLIVSIALVVGGTLTLRARGSPNETRAEHGLMGIEKTTRLVTSGLYRYIRHPLYSSLLFLTWGAFLKNPSLFGLILALAASLFLFWTARVEEAENALFFGEEYKTYRGRTRMFIPFIF